MEIPVATNYLRLKERLVYLLDGERREWCILEYNRCLCSSKNLSLLNIFCLDNLPSGLMELLDHERVVGSGKLIF